MSAIFGILNLSGVHSQTRDLQAMQQTLAHCGSDGGHLWQQGTVGLGHQMRHITPESLHEQLPWYQPNSQLTITADVRLDNREELLTTLNIPHPEASRCSDSQIILAAYEKWGQRCPQFLLGDFAFAIWDGRQRQLICCRDHMGVRPLFYYFAQQRFAFASEIKAILVLPGIEKRLNKQRLAAFTSPTARQQDKESTLFAGVLGLPPATLIVINDQGVQQQSYWKPNIDTRLPYQTDAELLSAFQTLFLEVITARLRSAFPVASLLSGGLDSSAIVSVAARCLAQQGKSLTVLSAVLPDNSNRKLKDERQYIDLFREFPNLDIKYVTAPGRGPLDDVEPLIWNSESPLVTSRHYLYAAFAEGAHQSGARIILDGAQGEAGPSFHGAGYLGELFTRGHWASLRHETVCRSALTGVPSWRILRSELLRPMAKRLPLWLQLRGGNRILTRQKWPILLQPAFVQQYFETAAADVPTRKPAAFSHRHNQYHDIIGMQACSRVFAFPGAEHIEMSYPFLDKRLLEFCLAAPGAIKVRDGYTRYLIRAGLNNIMPAKIQWRTSKEPLSPDFHLRYNHQRTQAQAFLAAIKHNDPIREIVNIDHLQSLAIDQMTNNRSTTAANYAGMHLVPKGIYLISFLRQFDEFQC